MPPGMRRQYQITNSKRPARSLRIKHTTTKVKHPWTNGYVERLNKTLLDEFYSVAFRKKRYESIEALQMKKLKYICDIKS
jgi:transposase InsO family protein